MVVESKEEPIRTDLHRIVRERIVSGTLAPGARIKEARLAEELGTSRTPLREALIKLEQEGFVRSELAHGFTVESLSGREVREIYPLLWSLETLALRISGSAVYSQLKELVRINAELANATDPEKRLYWDTQWHEALLSPCPNRRLNGLLYGLKAAAERYERLFMTDTESIGESVKQHQEIIEALQERDIERAERILTDNWRVTMDLLLIRLGEP